MSPVTVMRIDRMPVGEARVGVPNLHWDPIPVAEIEAARARTCGVALRMPLVRLDADDIVPAGSEILITILQGRTPA